MNLNKLKHQLTNFLNNENKQKAKRNMNKLIAKLQNNKLFSCNKTSHVTAKQGHTVITGHALYNVMFVGILAFMILDVLAKLLIGDGTITRSILSGFFIFIPLVLASRFLAVVVKAETTIDTARKLVISHNNTVKEQEEQEEQKD